jgi:2-oxoisovalerate dehydrogenase E2 component (dihydrolipoyl transacylase)
MPRLGESTNEGTVARWLLKPGDRVEELQPMFEVESEKVVAEVPSPFTGTLVEILVGEGSTVSVGAEVAVIDVASVAVADRQPADHSEQHSSASSIAKGAATITSSPARVGGPTLAPATRRLAEDLGVDVAQLAGSGSGGRVTRRDVESAVHQRPVTASVVVAAHLPALAPPPPAGADRSIDIGANDELIPLSHVRRLIADAMTLSKTTIPHAWQTQEVDMAGVVANRSAHRTSWQREEGYSLTYLPYVVAAAAAGLRAFPEVNATFAGNHIVRHGDINIGVSVGLEDRIVVPVIHKADGLSIAGLSRAIHDVAARAQAKRLLPDDVGGGTFTVNNSGTFGTLFSYSIINPGQAGILTMEAVTERPVAVNGAFEIRPRMYLCFSLDHRVMDGMVAARFLAHCRASLESMTSSTSIY